jgi:hypothetical protein
MFLPSVHRCKNVRQTLAVFKDSPTDEPEMRLRSPRRRGRPAGESRVSGDRRRGREQLQADRAAGRHHRRGGASGHGVLGAAISTRQLVAYADQWTDLRSRVDLATGSQEAGAAVMDRLAAMARRTYSSLGQTTESWLANATALRELGLTTRSRWISPRR